MKWKRRNYKRYKFRSSSLTALPTVFPCRSKATYVPEVLPNRPRVHFPGTTYRETVRVQIHANIRIRRIYFTDRLYEDEELPNEFKLFLPRASKEKRPSKEERKPSGAKDTPAPLTSAQSQKTEEEEKAIQMEEQEIPSGAPPTPVTSATVVTEEKPPEEGKVYVCLISPTGIFWDDSTVP